jgi:hypothetical protein
MSSGKSLERALMGSSIFHIMNHINFLQPIIPENARFRKLKILVWPVILKKWMIKCHLKRSQNGSLFKADLEIINIERK